MHKAYLGELQVHSCAWIPPRWGTGAAAGSQQHAQAMSWRESSAVPTGLAAAAWPGSLQSVPECSGACACGLDWWRLGYGGPGGQGGCQHGD